MVPNGCTLGVSGKLPSSATSYWRPVRPMASPSSLIHSAVATGALSGERPSEQNTQRKVRTTDDRKRADGGERAEEDGRGQRRRR